MKQKSRIKRLAGMLAKSLGIAVLVISVGQLGIVPSAYAQDDDKKPKRQTKKVQTLSQKIYEKLIEAQAEIEEKNYAQGLQMLQELRAQPKLNNFEQAQISNFFGFYYFVQEQYPQALAEYKKVIADPEGIPEGLYVSTFYTIAQLYFQEEDYQNALEYAQRWFAATPEPSADAYMLIGQAYYQLEQVDKAFEPVRTGIEMYKAADRVPKENWYLLLRALYYEKNDYESMLPLMREIITHYPKAQYLTTLAGIYSELGRLDKMMAIIEAMYEEGHLEGKPRQIVNLASLYLMHDIPIKAADLLGEHMEAGDVEDDERNLKLYSQALTQAKEYEKAINPLKEAAKKSDDGELYLSLGQSYMALDKWKEAEGALSNAIRMGGLKRPDQTRISLGLAQVELGEFEDARKTFQKAAEDKRSVKAAGQWIRYVDNEVRRLNALQVRG
jgi:tetratricopeptide (TPR) repeat protein